MAGVQLESLIALVEEHVAQQENGKHVPLNKLFEAVPQQIGRRAEELSAEEWEHIFHQIDTDAQEAGMVKVYLEPPLVPFQERGEYYQIPYVAQKREVQFVHEGSEDLEAFNLIPADLPIHKLYGQENTPTDEQIIWVKLFSPGHWTWYITEYRPGEKLAFGYVDGFDREWGYISIKEIDEMNSRWKASLNGSNMAFVERDLHFKPMKFSDLKWSVLDKEDG
jgi:hypothetical protein